MYLCVYYTASGYYASNPPKISLGSLALRSIYFAADFTTAGVGFASKGKVNGLAVSPDILYIYIGTPRDPACLKKFAFNYDFLFAYSNIRKIHLIYGNLNSHLRFLKT